MAPVGTPQRADEKARVDERVVLERLLERDHLGLHAEVARPRADEPEAVELALVGREHQAAVRMQPARLARHPLDLPKGVDLVLLQARDIRLAVESVHAPGGMPGRAGGELALLDEQHVAPADPGEGIEHARAHYAAADDHGPRRILHVEPSLHNALTVASAASARPKGREVSA